MNRGLSDALKVHFPNIVPSVRPIFDDIDIKDPNWLSGFTSGEGCFLVRVRNSSNINNLPKVELIFQITQHKRDINLIRSLIAYLDCGYLRERRIGRGFFGV